MEQQGWKIFLHPLILQRQAVVHPQAQSFLSRAQRLPLLSFRLLWANLSTFLRQPRCYLSTAARAFWENRTNRKFFLRALVIFPKSVAMARSMQKEGVQHIHAHYATHPALAAWMIHRLSGIPYSLTVHAHDIYVEKAMLATKLREAAFIAAISEFNRDYLGAELGETVREKIKVIRCGVLPENYAQAQPLQNQGHFAIVNIGSLQPYKGQKYLIEACALLRQRNIPIHCRIIGGGELLKELTHLIAAAGLEECVELLGARTQEEVAGLLAAANCYVQPSVITSSGKMEGIPVGIMEAMISGLPVVATQISGVPELVQNDQTGLLVSPENSVALADAIERLYRVPQLAQQLAQNGRTLVLQQYNLHKNVQTLSSCIVNVIGEHATI